MGEYITDAEHIWISTEEVMAFEEVMYWVSAFPIKILSVPLFQKIQEHF